MSGILNYTLFHSMIRNSTSILFAMLACSITQQANILNVGVEGIMLVAAFAAVATSFFTGSWVLAIFAAIIAGVLIALIIAVANIKYKADIFAVGMTVNMLALALTKFANHNILHASGSFTSQDIKPIPDVKVAALSGNAVVDSLFNQYNLMEFIGIILIFVTGYFMYKTVFGLRTRSIGMNQMAALTAGINVVKQKYVVMVISGVLGGLGGAYLSLGYTHMFTENMTNGRGFMGVAAMFFGNMNPVLGWVGCLLFGLLDSVGSQLQAYGIPSQLILMQPYIITVLILSAVLIVRKRKKTKLQSTNAGEA
ncbi:MAG TPA: ABC transporter permease [Ruminococcaceae bacterium]|nr:ABC transporter permease [Oscillospiraceae bacterium]